MKEVPNRFEVWIFYDPVISHSDWFKEKECNSLEEVIEFLKEAISYFHDGIEEIDKYFDVLAFHNSHELKGYFKSVSSILMKYDKEWLANFDNCMKVCKDCIMNCEYEDIDSNIDSNNDKWESRYLCRDGKTWFGKPDCPFYSSLSCHSAFTEDLQEKIDITKEFMKDLK